MNAQTHDTHIFSEMVEILVSSGLGEKDYGFTKSHHQTRLEEVASVMNQLGFSNRAGKPLNRNALKQVVHRIRQKDDLMENFKPKWSWFDSPIDNRSDNDSPSEEPTSCLVCGVGVPRKNRKTCSSECGTIYQEHKGASCDPEFPSIFHQMRYEESLSKKNH